MRRSIAVCCMLLIALGVTGCSGESRAPTATGTLAATNATTATASATATPTSTATLVPWYFVGPSGQLAPFSDEATLRSKRVQQHADGSATFHARVSDGLYTQDLSTTVGPFEVEALRTCWDRAEVGEPVPDCMVMAFGRDLPPGSGHHGPLELATPGPVPPV